MLTIHEPHNSAIVQIEMSTFQRNLVTRLENCQVGKHFD